MDFVNKPFEYKIIGTSHVSKNSVKEIEKEIKSFNPTSVCIELDNDRLQGLLTNAKSNFSPKLILKIGVMGYMFGLVGHLVQKKIGKKLNIVPGKDMLTAYNSAKNNNLKVYLIDQNVRVTLKCVSKEFKFKEKLKLFKDVLEGIFFSKRVAKRMNKRLGNVNFDLNSVPSDELVEMLILELKNQYPGLYKALVDDRNKYMARNVLKIMKQNPFEKLLIVVGAGHKNEMTRIIEKNLSLIEYIGKREA